MDKFSLLPAELLEIIFSYLLPMELIVLGDVNERFREFICNDSRLRPMYSTVVFKNFNEKRKNEIVLNSGLVEIQGLKLILSCIRIFRINIRTIVLNFSGSSKENGVLVFSQVNNYLRGLEDLTIVFLENDVCPQPLIIFQNLKRLHFFYCKLTKRLCYISGLFPRVEVIKFTDFNEFEKMSRILTRYDCLREMYIGIKSICASDCIVLQNLNPNVKIEFI